MWFFSLLVLVSIRCCRRVCLNEFVFFLQGLIILLFQDIVFNFQQFDKERLGMMNFFLDYELNGNGLMIYYYRFLVSY